MILCAPSTVFVALKILKTRKFQKNRIITPKNYTMNLKKWNKIERKISQLINAIMIWIAPLSISMRAYRRMIETEDRESTIDQECRWTSCTQHTCGSSNSISLSVSFSLVRINLSLELVAKKTLYWFCKITLFHPYHFPFKHFLATSITFHFLISFVHAPISSLSQEFFWLSLTPEISTQRNAEKKNEVWTNHIQTYKKLYLRNCSCLIDLI